MPTWIVLKHYTPEEFAKKWSKHAWKECPAKIVTIPFRGGVLFGAEQRCSARRSSFLLSVEDTQVVGAQLLKAAKEAENGIA
jgi:hypothetical protein